MFGLIGVDRSVDEPQFFVADWWLGWDPEFGPDGMVLSVGIIVPCFDEETAMVFGHAVLFDHAVVQFLGSDHPSGWCCAWPIASSRLRAVSTVWVVASRLVASRARLCGAIVRYA